jgi:hypothetical protein
MKKDETPRELLRDMSVWGAENQCYRRPTPEKHQIMFEKLSQQYPKLFGIDIVFPWIILEFEDELPAPSDRPFLIAGLVVVFVLEGEPFPFGINDMGRPGLGKAPSIPTDIKNDLRPYHLTKIETIHQLFILVPNAEFISIYPRQILVELEEMAEQEFDDYVASAPKAFGFLAAMYHNGPFYIRGQPRKGSRIRSSMPMGTNWWRMIQTIY